jgi:energy-coupling factor transport system permease protein
VKPLGVGLICTALVLIAVTADQPLLLAASAVAAGLLLWVSPGSSRGYLWFAAFTALTVFLINPFVGLQGLTVLWQGPDLPLIDTQVTTEELVFGIAAGLRIVASTLAVAAFVRLADGDRVLASVARVAPRSAMIAALAARLLPTLERDAAGIALAARSRGANLRARRPSAELVAPLIGLSLERSLALAEAMEARGFGSGPRTTMPGPPAQRRDNLLTVIGVALLCLAAWLLSGAGDYRYYDLLDDPFTPAAVAAASALLGLGAAAAGTVRWLR